MDRSANRETNAPLRELQHRARRLHRAATNSEHEAARRMRALDELSDLEDAALASAVRRRHALAVLARELGFTGWPHARRTFAGEELEDFGTLLYPAACGAHSNVWSAHYEEARSIRAETGGYLLAWKRQYLIVDEHYVRTLGLDPGDPDWELMGRDWVRPVDAAARERLALALIRLRLPS